MYRQTRAIIAIPSSTSYLHRLTRASSYASSEYDFHSITLDAFRCDPLLAFDLVKETCPIPAPENSPWRVLPFSLNVMP